MTALDKKTRADDGVLRVTIEHAPTNMDLTVLGRRFVATLDTDTNDDYDPGVKIEFQGVVCEVKDFSDGDYIELFVIQPNETVVAQYGEKVYIKPSGQIRVVADGTVTVPAPLQLRATYTSVATTGNPPVIYLDYFIWKVLV